MDPITLAAAAAVVVIAGKLTYDYLAASSATAPLPPTPPPPVVAPCPLAPQITQHTEDHIFKGQINPNTGKATGCHSISAINQGTAQLLPGAPLTLGTVPPNAVAGLYMSKVQILKPDSTWKTKGPESTFFPDAWNEQKIKEEVSSAFKNKVLTDNKWSGVSSCGLTIEGYLDSNGNIATAYPIMLT